MKKLLFAVVAMLVAVSCCKTNESVELVITYKDGTTATEVRPLKKCCFKDYIRFELSTEELADVARVVVTPSVARANDGEEGYFVAEDGLFYGFKHAGMEDKKRDAKNLRLSMSCLKTERGAYLAIAKSLQFESIQTYRHKEGKYTFSYDYDLSKCGAYEPLIIDLYPMPKGADDYSAMARRYREYLIESNQMPQMLKERVKDNEHLAYAATAPEIRIRQGWKPVPTPVAHQTLENEPEMRVAMTFDQVKDLIDELKRQGVEEAQLCLVGWNHKGHDGRYPTVFPVEPSLGGEEKLRECIKYAQENGYRIVGHTNRTDIYEISSDWNGGADAAKNPDGSLQANAFWSGGQMFNICYKQSHDKYFLGYEPKVAELGFRGLEYVDVLSIIKPHVCYDSAHPCTRREGVEYANKMLQGLRDLFGGSQSEGGCYFVAKSLDYAMYVTMTLNRLSNKEKYPYIDDYAPIWHIVFNGYLLHNPASQTVNFTLKEPIYALRNAEYAARPMFYFYSAFVDNPQKNWMGNADLTYKDKADLERSVAAIKRGYDEFKKWEYLQFETMEQHDKLIDGVYCSTYSDGTRVVVNYTKEPYTFEGVEVASENYIIKK